MEVRITSCAHCKAEIRQSGRGRPRKYCNETCSDRAEAKQLREDAKAYRKLLKELAQRQAA